MASKSNKTETETAAEIVFTATEPITDKSDSNPEEDDVSTNGDENSGETGDEQEEDDYESENGEEEEEEEEDDDNESIVDDGESTSDHPEWGVDSYDESSDYWSPDEDSFTDEEDERKARLYSRNLYFSHGFLVEEGIHPRQQWTGSRSIRLKSLDSEHSPVQGRTQLEYALDMVKLCLRKYNALNETDVKLDHIVRVTGTFFGRWVSYITFMAKESHTLVEGEGEGEGEDTLVEYQAKVVKKLKRKSYPIFCRPSRKMDQDM